MDVRPHGAAAAGVLPSPGMLDRHYAPRTWLLLMRGPAPVASDSLRRAALDELTAGRFPLLLAFDEDLPALADVIASGAGVERLGAVGRCRSGGRTAHAAMRAADALEAAGLAAGVHARWMAWARQLTIACAVPSLVVVEVDAG